MPTAVLRTTRSGIDVEGIAFAIPSNHVMEVASRIIADRASYPRPTLGLDHLDITPELAPRLPRLNADKGAYVAQVAAGGPAEAAGIEKGDIITHLGDSELDGATLLLNALMAYEPGDTVKVVLNRGGRIIETEVRLAKRS
jgi:S1-C subfamily serine protease